MIRFSPASTSCCVNGFFPLLATMLIKWNNADLWLSQGCNARSSLIAAIYPPCYRESNNNTILKNLKGAPSPFPTPPSKQLTKPVRTQCATIRGSFTNSASSQIISCSRPVSSFATFAGNVPPLTAWVSASA